MEANEARTIEDLCKTFGTILNTTAHDYNHAVRSVHAKAHGILEGTLTIDEGLPPELAQDMFAMPAEHAAALTMVYAVSFTKKIEGGTALPAALICIKVEPR